MDMGVSPFVGEHSPTVTVPALPIFQNGGVALALPLERASGRAKLGKVT
jgi:hypothetical protein